MATVFYTRIRELRTMRTRRWKDESKPFEVADKRAGVPESLLAERGLRFELSHGIHVEPKR
jgi:hypothetical protein